MTYRAPFVVTVTLTVAAVPACGGSTDSDGTSGTGGTSAAGGSGGNPSGGTSGSGGASGSGGTSGSGGASSCPADPPMAYASECGFPAGTECSYTLDCKGGPETFTFACQPGSYPALVLNGKPCDAATPYDSCELNVYCNPNGWSMPQGTNPPSPCPEVAPKPGDACFSGGFGGVREYCGYPCTGGWQVLACHYNPDGGQSAWELDKPCQ